MKNLIIIMSVILMCSGAYSQENISNKQQRFISIHLGYGTLIVPRNGLSFFLNFQSQNRNAFGYGMDLMGLSYNSSNLNKLPSVSEVSNFNPELDGTLPVEIVVNGDKTDNFRAMSFYISKGITKNKVVFNFQVGPSFISLEQKTFTYTYRPSSSFCIFRCGSYIAAQPSGRSKFAFGGYLRINAQVKLGNKTVLELSPFANINSKENIVGIRLGFVFGKRYKSHFFNQ